MNIVIVVADSLRADAVGPSTTPTLSRFAASGASAARAISSAPWTLPSLAAMLTGLHPHRVGLVHWRQAWPPSTPTLFDHLAGRGYQAHSFVFDPSYLFTGLSAAGVEGSSTDEDAMFARIGGLEGDGHVVFVHYWGTHVPYVARPMTPGTWKRLADAFLEVLAKGPRLREKVLALYALAARRFSEVFLPRLLDSLRRGPGLESTLVVITADHGESWGERLPQGQHPTSVFGLHGDHLFEEGLAVPLVAVMPGLIPEGTIVPGLSRTLDLTPTLLDLAGVPPLPGPPMDGMSVAHSLTRGAPSPVESALSVGNKSFFEVTYDTPSFPPSPRRVWDRWALRTESTAWIQPPPPEPRCAFDRTSDPDEEHPLDVTTPSLEQGWSTIEAERARAVMAPFPEDLVEETKRRLAALEATIVRRDRG